MRDDDAGPVGEKRVDRALDVPLRRGIEARRRLVEDHETRIAEEHAREREQLRLAGGEAAGEHLRVERSIRAVGARQRAQPTAETDAIEHRRDALVVDRRVEEGDVLAHARVEQLHVLTHQRRVRAHVGEPRLAEIDPTETDRARRRVVETEQETCEGRLAAAGAPEHAEHLARRETQRDVAQDQVVAVRARFIGERDAVELDRERAGRDRRAAALGQARLGAQQLGDAAHARDGALHVLELAAQLLDRPAEHVGVMEEQVDRSERDHAEAPEVCADAERDRVPDGEDEDRHGKEHRAGVDRLPT